MRLGIVADGSKLRLEEMKGINANDWLLVITMSEVFAENSDL